MVMNLRALAIAGAQLLAAPALFAQGADALYSATYLDEQPGRAAAGASAISHFEADLHREQGSLATSALQELDRPGRFVLLETWQNQAALTGHQNSDATLAFKVRLQALDRSPSDQRIHHGFDIDPSPRTGGAKAIYVVTHVDVPAASRADAETLLKALAAGTRPQRGQVRFDVLQQVEPRLNHFTLLAVWDGRTAFDAWGASPEWRQFMKGITPLLGAPYDERIYRRLTH